MLEEFATKILLGFSLAAPIGPVNAEMIKRGLAAGFWPAFNVRLGGICGNLLMLLMASFGLTTLGNTPQVMLIASAVGACTLTYMGINSIIKSLGKNSLNLLLKFDDQNVVRKYTVVNGLLFGFGLALANPIGITFWLSTFAASIQMQPGSNLNVNPIWLNLFIILGVLLWGILISLILHFCSKYVNNKTLRTITALSGLILLYFGVRYGIFALNQISLLP